MPTITVHHLERSRSHRALWLLEELGLPYTITTYTRDAKTMRAPASLRAVHPLGKSPVVEVDGVVVAESGAIVEHLVELAGGALRPAPGTREHQWYRFYLHYAEGSLMPPLLVSLITSQLRGRSVPFPLRLVTKAVADGVDKQYTRGEIKAHTAFLAEELAKRPFVAGDAFTAADVMMGYPVEALVERGGARIASLVDYLDRIRARPAYQAAITRGGPTLVEP